MEIRQGQKCDVKDRRTQARTQAHTHTHTHRQPMELVIETGDLTDKINPILG